MDYFSSQAFNFYFIKGISLNENKDLMITWDLKSIICPSVHVVGRLNLIIFENSNIKE